MQSCGTISRALRHCHRETTHLVAFLGISCKVYLKMCGVFRTTFQSNVDYFCVVQSLNRVWLFGTLWIAAHQAPLSSTISWSLLKFMPLESVMLSNHLNLCHPLLLLPSIFSSIRVFSSESALHISWPKYWCFSISPSLNIWGWFPLGLTVRPEEIDLLAIQGIHILDGAGHTPFFLPACLCSNCPCIFYTLFLSVIPTHPPRPPENASEKRDRNDLQNVCYLLAPGRSLLPSPGHCRPV